MTTLIAGSSEATDEREVLTLISLYGRIVSLRLRSAARPSERGKGATVPQLPRAARPRGASTSGDSLCVAHQCTELTPRRLDHRSAPESSPRLVYGGTDATLDLSQLSDPRD